MKFVLYLLISLPFFGFAKASEVSNSKIIRQANINQWLQIKLASDHKSILSKVGSKLSDKDRFELRKALKRRKKDKNRSSYAIGQLYVYKYKNRKYIFEKTKRNTVMINRTTPIKYNSKDIWRSVRRGFKKKKSAWWQLPLTLFSETAFAQNTDANQMLRDGVSDELLVFAGGYLVNIDVDSDLETLFRRVNPNFRSNRGIGKESVVDITCDSSKVPPKVVGSFMVDDEPIPFVYEGNNIEIRKPGGKTASGSIIEDRIMKFAIGRPGLSKEEKSCVVREKRQWISSQLKGAPEAARRPETAENKNKDVPQDILRSIKYDCRQRDEDRGRLFVREVSCQYCQSGQSAASTFLSIETNQLDEEIASYVNMRSSLVESFRISHNLDRPLRLDPETRELKSEPKTNLSSQVLREYSDQLKEIESNLGRLSSERKFLRSKPGMNGHLNDSFLTIIALSGCCGDNSCRANIIDTSGVNIVPSTDSVGEKSR